MVGLQGLVQAFAWLTLCGLVDHIEASSKHSKQAEEHKKVELLHHSFNTPLEYASLLGDWFVSGASIFERERLLLHPGVAERHGFAWSTKPVQTNNFEVTITFKLSGEELSKVPSDQSFALWLLRENISADFNESRAILAPSWLDGLKQQGYLLSGSKGLFEGFGAVFSSSNAENMLSPTVSFVSNDKHQTLSYGTDVPSKTGKSMDFRNTEAKFKLRVKADFVQGHVILDGKRHECFSVDRKSFPVKAGNYLGFTAWSGTAKEGKTSDSVSLLQVEVINFDDQTVGEDLAEASNAEAASYASLMSEGSRHFEDQKSQTQHIDKIAAMLSEHLQNTQNERQIMEVRMSSMMDSLQTFHSSCRTLTKEMHYLGNGKLGKAGGKKSHANHVEDMKHELIGLRRLLTKEGASHLQKIEAVQRNLLEVKEQAAKGAGSAVLGKIVAQTQTLEQTVESRGSQMSWMMMCLLGSVMVIGWLIWNRMDYYEKKHFS